MNTTWPQICRDAQNIWLKFVFTQIMMKFTGSHALNYGSISNQGAGQTLSTVHYHVLWSPDMITITLKH